MACWFSSPRITLWKDSGAAAPGLPGWWILTPRSCLFGRQVYYCPRQHVRACFVPQEIALSTAGGWHCCSKAARPLGFDSLGVIVLVDGVSLSAHRVDCHSQAVRPVDLTPRSCSVCGSSTGLSGMFCSSRSSLVYRQRVALLPLRLVARGFWLPGITVSTGSAVLLPASHPQAAQPTGMTPRAATPRLRGYHDLLPWDHLLSSGS